jgi:PAS domain S-box-containing protein
MSVEGREVLRHVRTGDFLGSAARRAAAESAIPLAAAVAYYFGCLAGFALRFPSSGISFFWPPNAILITALLVITPRRWPLLLASTFVAHVIAHVQDGIPPAAWSTQFLGNASQALLATWIIRRYGSLAIFANLRRVLIFVVGACLLAPAIASVAPSFVYVTLGWAPDFFEAWRARTVSNTVTTLTVVPALVILWRYRHTRTVRPRRLVEFAALLLGLFVADVGASYTGRADLLTLSITLYAMTPVLLWATVRFGGAGLSFALSATVLIISNAAITMSPVAGGVPADAIVGVQLLLTATAVPLMLLAGLLEEKRDEHRALVDMEQQTRAILRALPDTVLLHTGDGAILRSYPDSVSDTPRASGVRAPHFSPATDDQPAGALRVTEYTEAVEGADRRYEARSVAVDDVRMLTVIRDITDRWHSEQALRETQHRYALATGVGLIGVWDLDVPTGSLHVEGTLRTALGYSAEEIRDTASDWQSLIFDADRDDVLTKLAALVDGTTLTLEAEFRMTHKDGSLRWVTAHGGVTDMVDGKPTRVVGTYADVTERKESRRALREANDRLARVGRIAVIGEVTASIAHELSQPLTATTTNAVACLRSLDLGRTEAVREALNDILHDSRRAGQILDRTRRLFRHHSAQPTLLHLNDVVREVVKVATPRLRELDVRLTQTLEPNLPHVFADAVQMQQVLFNLIVNGADAMSAVAGRPRQMHVSTRYGKRYVVVSVRDSGVGLDDADTARVFEPFYTTKPGGSGMGLAISRSIVQSHGGALWAISNSDCGSTFRFKLPIPASRTPAPVRRSRGTSV